MSTRGTGSRTGAMSGQGFKKLDALRRIPPEPNEYDACLINDAAIWDDLISHGRFRYTCCPKGRTPYTQRPWIAMPKEGRRFKLIEILPVASIVTPYDGTDDAVLTTIVPKGYDGVISEVICELTANGSTGFIEGSGDVIWRLSAYGTTDSVSRRYLRDLGEIKVTLGSLRYPSPMNLGSYRVYSSNNIVFSVALAVGAEATINPQANIVCSISGWWYPRSLSGV